MHCSTLRRRLAPVAAIAVGCAAFTGAANAAAPVGGPVIPAIGITYNTGEILFTDPPADPTTATVQRGAAALASGTFNAPDPLAPGEFGVNSFHLALAGVATGCWNAFVPQILPGDTVTVAGQDPVSIPDITAEAPVVEGNAVVVHGTAGAGVDTSLLDIQIAPAGAGKFAGGVGSSGGQFLSSLAPRGFAATFAMDPGSATKWTARFTGLDAGSFAQASTGTATVVFDPFALAAVDPAVATTVGYEAAATPGSAPGCGVAYMPNEAKGASRSMVNAANVANDLNVTGVSQPGASATGITLIDSTGNIVAAPAIGAGTWSATVPAASLARLSDGAIKIASTYTIGAGKTVTGLLNKDTTAPSAPTASLAAGHYVGAQSVSLSAAEGTIRYTTDGSDPTASSKAYSKAIPVTSVQTIKAVAIDAAGNLSDVASFAYAIAEPAAPAPAPAPPVAAPKLKLDALTIGSSYRLKTVRKRGISMVVFAPEGAKFIKVRLLRNGHVITRMLRKVSKDGVMTIVLPTTKTGRRHLKRGTYKVQVTPGQSAAQFGATTTRTVRIR
jgi:hypothetical protein